MPLSQGITLAHMAARSSCPPASPSGASVCQRFVSLSSRSQVSSPCATTPPPFFGAPALSSPARPSRGGPVREPGVAAGRVADPMPSAKFHEESCGPPVRRPRSARHRAKEAHPPKR